MSKFTDELKQLATDIRALPEAEREKAYEGLRACIGPVKSSRRDRKGNVIAEVRDVDLSQLANAVPPDLRQDMRQLQRSFIEEVKKRGQAWADESLHLVITNRLLPTPVAEEAKAPAPSIDLDKLADMVATKLQDRANAKLQQQNPPAGQ
jgi:hypothetical protein